MMKTPLIIVSLFLAAAPASAQQGAGNSALPLANAQLDDANKEQAASELMENIRCIQCQGQSIADSNAPIAATMRHEIRTQMQAGKSADDVRSWLVSRYGEWVTFEPRFSAASWPLYLAPLIVLLFGAALVFRRFGGAGKQGDTA